MNDQGRRGGRADNRLGRCGRPPDDLKEETDPLITAFDGRIIRRVKAD
ncbi:hypothetical protein ACFW84_25150 [Streptomyces anulatus]